MQDEEKEVTDNTSQTSPSNDPTPNTGPQLTNNQEGLLDMTSPIQWTASEYLAQNKSFGWYVLLSFTSIALSAAVYFITNKDLVSAIIILIAAVALGAFSARTPQVLNYSLDNRGLHIDKKFYPYSSFRSFSLISEDAMTYISLLSLRRFMPPISLHYEPADEDQIVNVLSKYLPYEEHKPDLIDQLARRFRL